MKKCLFVCLVALAAGSFAQVVNKNYQDGEIYVKLKNTVPINTSISEDHYKVDLSALPLLNSMKRTYAITNLARPFASAQSPVLTRIYRISFGNSTKVEQFLHELESSNQFEYVEKVPMDRVEAAPNDPSFASQWDLAKINAIGAWAYSTGNANITVADVDDAVDINHPDLSPNIWTNPGEIAGNGIDDDNNGYKDDVRGWNPVDNNGDPTPPSAALNHGTHVSGIIGAKSNNGIGVASIGYGISIIPVRCATATGSLTYGDYGIFYAIVAGARVINMSFGGSAFSQTRQNLMDFAYSRNIVLVASSGNGNVDGVSYPSGYNHVICISATAPDDTKASYSNFNVRVDLSAPGDNIYSTDVNNGYNSASGTSFATPEVAGLVGLMLSVNPYLTPADVLKCLKDNADNIDGVNPSYAGKLGAGRINAANTMACVQASTLWTANANFSANFTTVSQGGNVTFTDSSIHNPTSWNWTFAGGTPGSFTGKIPPAIKYNTIGTFDVTLTVGNPNGPNTLKKTSYITVTTPGTCVIGNLSASQTWTQAVYGVNTTGSGAPDKEGYMFGLNGVDGDKQKANYFDNSATPASKLTRVQFYFYKAASTNLNKVVMFNIYDSDGAGGAPGTLLGTSTRTMGDIRNAVLAKRLLTATFSPPVSVPASQKFYVGIDYSNLDWATSKDSLAMVSNTSGQTNPSAVWQQKSDGTWVQEGSGAAGTWNTKASMFIYPFTTDTPPIAVITSSSTTICQGENVNLDATGSTHQDTLLWYVPGSNTILSSNLSQNFTFSTPGTYLAKLYVVGGGCREVDSASTLINVNAVPDIAIASSAGPTICAGSSTVLTASGASSYTWSPSTGLNSTNTAIVTANPGTTVTYDVSGSNGTCSGSTSIIVNVDQPLSLSVTETPGNAMICEGATVKFDGASSTNVTSFSWTFPGGTPSTSNLPAPIVTFPTNGNYTATLTASNQCYSDNTYTKLVSVNICTGVTELLSSENISGWYNQSLNQVDLTITNSLGMHGSLPVNVYNQLGQSVYIGEFPLTGDNSKVSLGLPVLSAGVYTVRLIGNANVYSKKFVVE